MSSIAQLARVASAIAITCVGLAAGSPTVVHAQDMSGPERKKMEEMLHGVRGEIAKSYYDSTYGGMNLSAVYDSAAARIHDAHSIDAALAAIAWFTLELHDSHSSSVPRRERCRRNTAGRWQWSATPASCFE
jgi:hypothetical protein